MEKLNATLVQVANNGNVKFPIIERQSFLQTSIDDIDLDVRSSNCLHRNNMLTVQDVINRNDELYKIKNCGRKSINRIMYKICVHYYNQLEESEKTKYLENLVELNTK